MNTEQPTPTSNETPKTEGSKVESPNAPKPNSGNNINRKQIIIGFILVVFIAAMINHFIGSSNKKPTIDLGDNNLKFCPDEIYTSGFDYVSSTYVGKQIRKKGVVYFVSSNSNGSARIIFNDFFKGGLSGGFSGGSSGSYDRVFFCDIDAKENEKIKSIRKGTYITVEGKGGITRFPFEHSSENFHLIYPKKIPYLLDCKIINIDEERRYNFDTGMDYPSPKGSPAVEAPKGSPAGDDKSQKLPLGVGNFDEIRKQTLTSFEIEFESTLNKSLIINVRAEIVKEHEKDTKQFFVIQKCLEPCLKSPSTCYDDMADYYHESIYKLIRSTAALTLAFVSHARSAGDTSLSQESALPMALSLANTLYLMAGQGEKALALNIFNKNYINDEFAMGIREMYGHSPVADEIMNSSLDDKSKQRLIGIWYLRKVHSAAELIAAKLGISDRYQKAINLFETDAGFFDTLSIITYESMPANIDWSKYNSNSDKYKPMNDVPTESPSAQFPAPSPTPNNNASNTEKRCDIQTISKEKHLPKWNIEIIDSSVIASMLKDAEKNHLPFLKINASDNLKQKLEIYINKNPSKFHENSQNAFTCEPGKYIRTSSNIGIQLVSCNDDEMSVVFLNLISPVDNKARVYTAKTFDYLFEDAPVITKTEETVINGERGAYVAVKYETASDGTGSEHNETDVVHYLFLGDKLRFLTDWNAFHIEESWSHEDDGTTDHSCDAKATLLRLENSEAKPIVR